MYKKSGIGSWIESKARGIGNRLQNKLLNFSGEKEKAELLAREGNPGAKKSLELLKARQDSPYFSDKRKKATAAFKNHSKSMRQNTISGSKELSKRIGNLERRQAEFNQATARQKKRIAAKPKAPTLADNIKTRMDEFHKRPITETNKHLEANPPKPKTRAPKTRAPRPRPPVTPKKVPWSLGKKLGAGALATTGLAAAGYGAKKLYDHYKGPNRINKKASLVKQAEDYMDHYGKQDSKLLPSLHKYASDYVARYAGKSAILKQASAYTARYEAARNTFDDRKPQTGRIIK